MWHYGKIQKKKREPHCNAIKIHQDYIGGGETGAVNFLCYPQRFALFCICQIRFLMHCSTHTHILFLHITPFISDKSFRNLLSVFQPHIFLLLFITGKQCRCEGEGTCSVLNYYWVHLSAHNETRSTWSAARPSICNTELEPLVHSAHCLACKHWWRAGMKQQALAFCFWQVVVDARKKRDSSGPSPAVFMLLILQ